MKAIEKQIGLYNLSKIIRYKRYNWRVRNFWHINEHDNWCEI